MENEILNNQGFDILESNEKHEKESAETDKKKHSTWETIDVTGLTEIGLGNDLKEGTELCCI
jgi:hypothetical protein